MATIETLDGPLDTSELGTVLMHEHVFNITAEIQMVHPGYNGWDPEVHVPAAQEELRGVKEALVPAAELRRSKDHLKGSLMLSLENTASRMSHLARQEIYFDRQFGLDETLEGIERVTAGDVQRVASDLFQNGSLSATVLGNLNGLQIPRERLDLD